MLIPSASATTVFVNGSMAADDAANHTWKTVQKGINDAAPGDTIFVYNGTYNENVTFNNNSVTLEGESRDGVVIDHQSGSHPVVTVAAHHITIQNVTLKRGNEGVYASGSSTITAGNGTLDNVSIVSINLECVYLYQVNDWTIHDTTASTCVNYGLRVEAGSGGGLNLRVWSFAVNVTTYDDGLYLANAVNASFSNITVQDAGRYGLYSYYGVNERLSHFVVNSSGNIGIYAYAGAGLALDNGSTWNNSGAGLYLYSSDYGWLDNVTIENNTGDGIDWYYSSFWTLRSVQNNNTRNPYWFYYNSPIVLSYWQHDIDQSNLVNGLPVIYYTNATSGNYTGPAAWFAAVNSSGLNVTITNPIVQVLYGVIVLGTNSSTFTDINASFDDWNFVVEGSNNNTFRNLTMAGSRSVGGIYMYASSWNLFDGGNWTNASRNYVALDVQGASTNNTVSRVALSGWNTGVYLRGLTADNRIANCTFEGGNYPLRSDSATSLTVEWSHFNGSYYEGLTIYGYTSGAWTRAWIHNSTFNHTLGYYSDNAYIQYLSPSVIENNTFNDAYALVALTYSTGVRLQNNAFSGSRTYGLDGYASDYIQLYGNTFTQETIGGIYFDTSSYWTLRSNTWVNQSSPVVFNIPYALQSSWTNHDADTSNVANGLPMLWVTNATTGSWNGSYGWIALSNSSNVTLTSTSNLSRNWCGILSFFSNDSLIQFVNTTGNANGACLYASRAVAINDSRFENNTAGGAYFWRTNFAVMARDTLRPDVYRQDTAIDYDDTSNNDTVESVDCAQFYTCVRSEYYASDIAVLNSTFNDTNYGMYLNSGSGHRVERSRLTNSSYEQITLLGHAPYGAPFRIANNTIDHTLYYYSGAILVEYGVAGTVENNTQNDSYFGVSLSYDSGIVVQDNHWTGNRNYAVQAYLSSYCDLVHNTFNTSTSGGISFDHSSFFRLRNNTFPNQTLPVYVGTYAGMPVDHTIHDLDTSNLANGLPMLWVINATTGSWNGSYGWLAASNSSNITLTSTAVLSRNWCGAVLMFTYDSQVRGVNATGNSWGACAYYSDRDRFTNSTVNANSAGGVYVWKSNYFMIDHSLLRPDVNLQDYGVQFDDTSHNGTLESVDCARFNFCVRSEYYANDIAVLNSTINDSYYGIYSNSLYGPRVEGSAFINNSYEAITVYGHPSYGIRIANNTFNHTLYYYSNTLWLGYVASGVVENNTLDDSYQGVDCYVCTGGNIQYNTFGGFRRAAIYGGYSTALVLVGNHIRRADAGVGIYFDQSRYWTLAGNDLSNMSTPVVVNSPDPVSDATLFMHYWSADNTIHGQPVRYFVNATGVNFSGPAGWLVAVNSSLMTLQSTTLIGPLDWPVLLVDVFNATVRDTAVNGSYGSVGVYWGADNVIQNFTGNGTRIGVYLSNATRTTISAVSITNATSRGVQLSFASTRVNVTGSSFSSTQVGVYAGPDSGYLNITGNAINGSTNYGVELDQTDNVFIVANTFNGSAYAEIYLYGYSSDHIDGLVVAGNSLNSTTYGYSFCIEAYYVYSAIFDNNTLTNCSRGGLYLAYSNTNTVHGQVIWFGSYGIDLYASDSNTFTENNVSNASYALYFETSADFNTLYHNNFYLSSGATYDFGTANVYDNGYPSGGNYWSNGTHTDANHGAAQNLSGPDGIQDSSQTLYSTKKDLYPLSEPWAPYVRLISPPAGAVIRAGTILDYNVSFYFDSVQYALNNGTGANLSSPFDISTANRSDGDLFVRIWANDSTGYNLNLTYLFVIDSTPPTITADAPPVGGTYPVGTQLNFTVSDPHFANNATWNNGSGNNSFAAPFLITTAGWAEGDYNITIVAWDTAGNSRTAVFLFKLDSTPPTVVLNSPSNNSFIAAGTVIDLTVSDLHLSNVTWNNGSGSNALAAPFDISTAGWGGGTYNLTVTATDTGGLATVKVYVFTIDATPPSITLNTPLNNSVFEAGVSIDLDVSDTNLATVLWNNGSGNNTLSAPYDISTAGWADGAYNVSVTANDTSGNVAVRVFHFEVDSQAPVVVAVSPANNSFVSAGTLLDFSVADAHLSTVTWSNGSGNNTLASPYDVPTSGWADGNYTVVVSATDTLGHNTSRALYIKIDSLAPTIALNAPVNGSVIRAGATIDLSVSDANLNTVTWNNGSGANSLVAPFDIVTGGWPDAVVNLTVIATDLAGNARTAVFRFTFDSTPPSITLDAPANGSLVRPGTQLNTTVSDANLLAVVWNNGSGNQTLSSPWDIPTTNWADGPFTVQIWANDTAGNARYFTIALTIDGTPPTVTLDAPANNSVVRPGTQINTTVSDANLQTVTWSNGSGNQTLTSPWYIATSSWADGVFAVQIWAADGAGNVRYFTVGITIDGTPPNVTLDAPANGSVVRPGTQLNATVADANLASVVWNNGSGNQTLTSPWDISTAGWADGAFTVQIWASDAAGNQRYFTVAVTIDGTLPTVTLVSPPNGGTVRAGTAIRLNVSDANLASVTWTNGSGTNTLGAPYDIATGGWADGSYTITVNASDAAGNLRQASFLVVLDSTPPVIVLVSPSAGAFVPAGTVLDLDITDANLSLATFANGSGTFPLPAPFNISTAGWPDGTYNISVWANDTAGNAAWLNFTVVIDSTPPAIQLVSPPNGSVIRAGVLLLFNLTDANFQNASFNNGTADLPLGAPASIDTTGYFERNYNITVWAADRAGNVAVRQFNFTVDSTPPQVILLAPANNTWLPANVVIDFSVSDPHLVQVNATLDGLPVALAPGYDYNSNNLTDGNHTFVIIARDAAGNSANLSAAWSVDKTAPRLSVTPPNGSTVRAGTPWVIGIIEANVQSALWKFTTDASFQALPSNHTLDTSTWLDGPVDIDISVTDLAGNKATGSFHLTIDSTPPVIDALTLTPATKYVKRGVPIEFTLSGEPGNCTVRLLLKGAPVIATLGGNGVYSFTFTTEPEDNSDYDFTFNVTDAAGNTVQLVRSVKLDSTPPVLPSTFPMNYSGNEDSPFFFQGSATDYTALATELTFAWSFNDSRVLSDITLTGQSANWTFTTPGAYAINVTVTDPAGNANNTTFTITIFDITPPSLSLPVTYINTPEDTPVNINQTSSDNGNGTLNWTWRAPSASLISYGPNITWIFTTPGVYNISVTVTDPSNNSARGFVVVNVSDITPPDATIEGPSVVDVFVPALFHANATDNDPRFGPANWSFNWSFTSSSSVISKFGQNTTFTDSAGETVTVALEVRDRAGNLRRVTRSLLVNEPPVVGSQPTSETNTSQLWQWQVNASDPEGQGVTVAVAAGPSGMSVNGSTVSWTPTAADAGAQNVSIAISDGLTTVYRNFTLFVVDPGLIAGNHPPVFDSDPPLDARVARTYYYDIQVHDDDNDSITITVSGIDGYAYNRTSRELSWVPPWEPGPLERFERLVPVTITAFDGKQSTTQQFTIRFRNPPDIWPELIAAVSLGDHHVNDTIRIALSGNWTDRDDRLADLIFVVNSTDRDLRSKVAQILRWHVDTSDSSNPVLVFEVVGEGSVDFDLVARDPSGGKSDNNLIHINAERVQPPGQGIPWWLLLIIAIGGAAGAAGLAVALRRSRAASDVAKTALETASRAPTERVIIQQAPAAAEAPLKDTYVIEGVFIIYGDGRLIYSKTDISEVKFQDPELVASMFSAVQSFIKDSFQAQGELNRLGFGENAIMIERGTAIFMAAVIYGEPTPELTDQMRETIRTIENAYAGIIEDWDGSTTSLEAIDQYVEPFLALTAALTRADVKQALTEKVVKMLSELEFFQGFVRLKCGVKNDTESVITKVTVSIDFNEDVLRLHHVEPDTYKFAGSEVQLGVLNPGEKVSVAYYFDPQICTESQIDGVARYRDSKGAVHSIGMKTRKAEVVCPIFFTKEHANTAMLKRLVEGELDQRDSKVYNVRQMPDGMAWSDLFSLVKEVVLGHDVHLVRDFVVEEPYHGEAWFYGETKVKGYKIVIRASVMKESGRIEFFAASTQIRAITGLLAEFNHTLQSLIGRKFATLKVEAEFDDEVKQEIQKKSLMGQMGEGELEGGETDQG